MKNKKTDVRRKWKDIPKCDYCGKRGKIYRRKNYTHGKKSKPTIIKICGGCRKKGFVKRYK